MVNECLSDTPGDYSHLFDFVLGGVKGSYHSYGSEGKLAMPK